MNFEWDEGKRTENLRKHHFDFVDAEALWMSEPWTDLPARSARAEGRSLRVAPFAGKYWTMVYTWRGEVIRVISVRRSRKGEIDACQQRRL